MKRRALTFMAVAALQACATAPASIGAATMTPDRVIHLQLRAEGPDGAIGDALINYAPGDPHYEQILAHLGGLQPGEEKPVPPFPE